MSIVQAMVEQRRLAHHARCRVKEWRISEPDAWTLAYEVRWLRSGIQFAPQPISEIVQSMKRGEVSMFGARVRVKHPAPIVVDSAAWTGR